MLDSMFRKNQLLEESGWKVSFKDFQKLVETVLARCVYRFPIRVESNELRRKVDPCLKPNPPFFSHINPPVRCS